jgi:hypothetical protein
MTLMESAQLLGNFGEFFGAIAVVVTLVYLALQIRQNTRATLADSRQSVGQITTDMMLAICINGEFAEIWRRGLGDLSLLSVEERWRWNHHAYAKWDSLEISHTHWRRRMLSDGDWEKIRVVIANYLTSPGLRTYWGEAKESFHPDFQQLVESVEPKSLGLTTFPSG